MLSKLDNGIFLVKKDLQTLNFGGSYQGPCVEPPSYTKPWQLTIDIACLAVFSFKLILRVRKVLSQTKYIKRIVFS